MLGTILLCLALTADDSPRRLPVSRADLALAYQRFESAFLANRPTGDRLTAVNDAFDAVTRKFFSLDLAGAIKQLNREMLHLQEKDDPTSEALFLTSLKVVVDPPITVAGKGEVSTVSVGRLYNVAGETPDRLKMIFRSREDSRSVEIPLKPDSESAILGQSIIEWAGERVGTWDILIVGSGGKELPTGRRLITVREDLANVRGRYESRLSQIKSEELASAVAIAKGRNALLTMTPAEARSAEFLADYNGMVHQLDQEIKAVESGKDPYVGMAGDYWRQLGVGKMNVPFRVYAPTGLTAESQPPLFVVLHGAGGDENMFMDAYGVGAIKRIADEKRAVIASPATTSMTIRKDALPVLIDEMSRCYGIDRKRVYVLGHSMGGGVTAMLAGQHPDLIRACGCLAGFRGFGSVEKVPPTLIIAAERDAIVPRAALETGFQQAKDAGLPVEFKHVPRYGHTLVVEAELSATVEWLLSR